MLVKGATTGLTSALRYFDICRQRFKSRYMFSQWETPLQSNVVCHWLPIIRMTLPISCVVSCLPIMWNHLTSAIVFPQNWWNMMASSNGNIVRVIGHWAGNSPVTGEFPAQRPVPWSFCVFFVLRLNKRLCKQSRCRWFETPSRPLWRHCNVSQSLPI